MNTEQTNQPPVAPQSTPQPAPRPQAAPEPITSIVNALEGVDTSSPQARVNETSISDNNGKRIELNDGTDRYPGSVR